MTENDDHLSSVLRDLGSEPHDLPLESVLEHIPAIRRRRRLRTFRRLSAITLAAASIVAVYVVGMNVLNQGQSPSNVGVFDGSSQTTTHQHSDEPTRPVDVPHDTPDGTSNGVSPTITASEHRRSVHSPRSSTSPLRLVSPQSTNGGASVRLSRKELRPYADVVLNTDVLGTLVKVVGKHDAVDVVDHGDRDVMCLEAVCAGGDRREISCMGSGPVPEVVTRPNGEVVLRRHRTSSTVVDVVGVTSRIDGTSMLAWYDCGTVRDRLPSGTTCAAYRLEKMGDVTAQRASDGSVVVTFLNGSIVPTDARITIQGLDNRPFGPLTRIAGTDAQEIGIVGSLPAGLHKITWTTSDGHESRLVVIP